MSEQRKCGKCGGNLQAGFFYVRNNENPAFFYYTVWVEGDGNKITQYMREGNAPQHKVVPHRCESCGLIEFYADAPEKWRH